MRSVPDTCFPPTIKIASGSLQHNKRFDITQVECVPEEGMNFSRAARGHKLSVHRRGI